MKKIMIASRFRLAGPGCGATAIAIGLECSRSARPAGSGRRAQDHVEGALKTRALQQKTGGTAIRVGDDYIVARAGEDALKQPSPKTPAHSDDEGEKDVPVPAIQALINTLTTSSRSHNAVSN